MNYRSQNSYAGLRDQYELRHSLNIGLIVPFSNFLKKQYEKSVGAAVSNINKKKYNWAKMYYLDEETIHTEMMSINPSPTGTTNIGKLEKEIVSKGIMLQNCSNYA